MNLNCSRHSTRQETPYPPTDCSETKKPRHIHPGLFTVIQMSVEFCFGLSPNFGERRSHRRPTSSHPSFTTATDCFCKQSVTVIFGEAHVAPSQPRLLVKSKFSTCGIISELRNLISQQKRKFDCQQRTSQTAVLRGPVWTRSR